MADLQKHERNEIEGALHVHVHEASLYIKVFFALIALTVITVITSYIDIDGFIRPGTLKGAGGINFLLAMIIATAKASFVCLWFMHLKDDARFNSLVFVGSVLFASVFLAYTLNDTYFRKHEDMYQGQHVDPSTGERAPGGLVPLGGPCEVPANCVTHACEGGRCVPFRVVGHTGEGEGHH
ncbi:MAG: cytochrome C oxidase subunit IV family protein [Sandaracinaceae bacterium]|nr:cytochrome C oxidase subunit IV family protein [Sandaracinaceae bacterium]MDW8247183.1 cytochrome C oxidase subunit IV family protein [Sandaracinaceae bacterium]